MLATLRQQTRFLTDAGFWLALLAGPVVWTGLWLIGLPLESGNASDSTWLYVVLTYPVLEEIVFRSGLQGALLNRAAFRQSLVSLGRQRTVSLSLANLTASIVFAGFHLLSQPPLWALLVLAPSLVFGWMYERHRSVLPSIALHIVYNAGFVFLYVSA